MVKGFILCGMVIIGLLSCIRRLNVVERSEVVFGSNLRIKILGEDRNRLTQAADSVLRVLKRFDSLWSVFSESSEVSQLNRNRRLKVSPETRDLIVQALGFGEKTGGVFDITVGPLMKLWGLKEGDFRLPDSAEIRRVLKGVGLKGVVVSGDSVFLNDGTEIDLGGIAVGFAVDRAVMMLKSMGAIEGLIDAGGDIRVFGERNWRIGVQSPRGESLTTVVILRQGAISTSGDYRRFFEIGGRRYSHIVDPRSGYPADRCLAVTVKAPSCVEADVYATALFVMGPDEGGRWLMEHKGVGAIFYVFQDDSMVEIRMGFDE
ncbi:MAG: FAD:protein FMN transferase [bacterium]